MTTETKDRIYFVKNQVPRMKNSTSEVGDLFIGIKHGQKGYHPTTIFNQEHADAMNRKQGITKAMAAAAHICSMFGTWDRFEQTAQEMENLA